MIFFNQFSFHSNFHSVKKKDSVKFFSNKLIVFLITAIILNGLISHASEFKFWQTYEVNKGKRMNQQIK